MSATVGVMRIKKHPSTLVEKYILLSVAELISGTAMLSGNITIEIVSMWFLCCIAIILCEFDLLHPYFCYSVGFCLYATAYPILCIIEGNADSISKALLPLNWIAFSTFLIVMSPKKATTSTLIGKLQNFALGRLSVTFVGSVLFVVLYFYFFVLRMGVVQKGELNQNFFTTLWFQAGVVTLFIYSMTLMILLKNGRNDISKIVKVILLVLVCGIALFLQGSIGERDCWFRFIGVSIFTFYAAGVLKNKHLLMLIPIIIAVLALSVSYKYYFLAGRLYKNDNSIIQNLLKSDFFAASYNLEIIIDSDLKGYFSPLNIITELLPGIGVSNWFSYEFMHASYGMGFSIVGFGYITCGIVGIVIVMIAVALIIKYVYFKSVKSIYYFAAYINSILYLIYACRGTLATVVTKTGLCVSIGLILSILLRRKGQLGKSNTEFKEFLFGVLMYVVLNVPYMIFT